MSRALLLVGHGSHLNADSSAPVYAHAKALRERGLFDEVLTAFWKEEPSLSRALDGCVPDDVTVVPVFMSAGYFTNEVIPREMGLSGPISCVRGKQVRYTAPVGSHPALASVIVQRAIEAGATPGDALAVLGHGTERNRQSQANIYQQTENVRVLGGFAEVVTVFMDQSPGMNDVFALTSAPDVVVVPVFIADGWHAGQTIPEELGALASSNRSLRYAAAVGTQDVLDLLHALTEADAAATGPAAWSDWKKSLVDDLVARTREVLAGRPRPDDPRTTGAQRMLSEAVRATSAEGVTVILDDAESAPVTTVTVAAPDRTGLLSTVAGVLSLHRLQVRAAQIDTVTAGDGSRRAVQVWTVTPAYGDPPPVERLREDLSRAITGALDVAARLDARSQAYPAPAGTAAPTVTVVAGASERATVLEVRAHDAPALLHRVTRAIAAADVTITAARVATLGSEVVDVFYLVDRDGIALSETRAATVSVTVLAELSAG